MSLALSLAILLAKSASFDATVTATVCCTDCAVIAAAVGEGSWNVVTGGGLGIGSHRHRLLFYCSLC